MSIYSFGSCQRFESNNYSVENEVRHISGYAVDGWISMLSKHIDFTLDVKQCFACDDRCLLARLAPVNILHGTCMFYVFMVLCCSSTT